MENIRKIYSVTSSQYKVGNIVSDKAGFRVKPY